MPEAPVEDVARHRGSRVATGSPELDEMLRGGLVGHRPYLLVGPSGTGKTTVALQFLCEGVRRGEKCLIVTTEEPPNEILYNHRSLEPDLQQVYVFDAIPDVMRYERTPFKDISAVRASVPFRDVSLDIRRTPELTSVEVTFTALEQMLKTDVARRGYGRIVIDSLTALEYFCMKGFDETLGAQTFLRFLSDLGVTTLLTVEAPLEDVETPERLLARGELRLFRWEHEGRTVRAVGVEKFRGSEHDVRLHPYRISPRGIDINLAVTISRDTRQILTGAVAPASAPVPTAPAVEDFASVLATIEADTHDLVALGLDAGPVRRAISEAVAAADAGRMQEASVRVSLARSVVLEALQRLRDTPGLPVDSAPAVRLYARAAEARAGISPASVPDSDVARPALTGFLHRLDELVATAPPTPAPTARAPAVAAEAAPGAPAVATGPPAAPPPAAPPPEPAAVVVPAFDVPVPVDLPPPLPKAVPTEPPAPPRARGAAPPAAQAPLPPSVPHPPPLLPPPLPDVGPPAAPAPTAATQVPFAAAPADAGAPPTPPKRRRKPSAAPKRRAPTRVSETEAVPGTAPEAPLEAAAPAKPKRRASPRRKAPPVTAAQPGAPPPDEHRVETPGGSGPGPSDVPPASPPPDPTAATPKEG